MYTLHDVRAIPGNGGTQPLQTDKGIPISYYNLLRVESFEKTGIDIGII